MLSHSLCLPHLCSTFINHRAMPSPPLYCMSGYFTTGAAVFARDLEEYKVFSDYGCDFFAAMACSSHSQRSKSEDLFKNSRMLFRA